MKNGCMCCSGDGAGPELERVLNHLLELLNRDEVEIIRVYVCVCVCLYVYECASVFFKMSHVSMSCVCVC